MFKNFFKFISVIFLLVVFAFAQNSFAQLTGTKTIPGNYATVALAIADLNTQGVGAGGVTFNVAAGHTETLSSETAGTITATGTSGNPIVFQKSGAGANPLITAYAWTVATAFDGMIKIAGGDYITFDGIDLLENSANTTIYTDWGYALVKGSATAPFNGCQYVTIKNCTVTLNKTNTSSIGIYTANHIATATTSLTIVDPTDANNNNKFFGNTITNCYSAISLNGFAATTPFTLYDQNNEVGVTAANTITNFGGGSVSARAIYGIYQNGLKVVGNSISSSVVGSTTTVYGVFLSTGTSSSADINNNTISLSFATGAYTSTIYGINNAMGSTAASNTININNNIFQNCDFSGFSTGNWYAILNSGTATTVNINSNTVNNITMAGTGSSSYVIEMGSPVTGNMNSNTITNITRTGASGTQYGLKIASPTNLTANGNTVDGINYTNTASTGSVYGFYGLSSSVNVTVTNNIFRNFSTPTTGALYGIREYGVSGTKIIQNNQVYNFSTYAGGAGGASLYGIYLTIGNIDISNNLVYSLTSTGTTGGTAGVIYGLYISGGTTNSMYKNKVYDLSSASTNPVVYGIYIGGGTTNTIYNNLVGDLRATAANAAIPLVGIYLSGGTTNNVYYNTVYLNATSTGALFGSSAVYASSTPTVNFIDNIFVNTSTPVGLTGFTTAYRRTSTTLTTYGATSNNNDFYAGVPGVNNLIFYDGTNSDQTIAAYKGRVAPRDAASFTENPNFVSTVGSNANFLHINPAIATQLESGGTNVAGITDDFDGNTRNATTPDVGADEFAGIALDLTPPAISYTPLLNAYSTANRTLTASITDAGSGVPTAGLGLPKLYWKKNFNGVWTGVTSIYLSGSNYQFSFGGGVAANDTVFYYVVAQDGATTPNVGAFPSAGAGGFTPNPPTAATPPTTPTSYIIIAQAPLAGSYTVGSSSFNMITGKNIYYEKVIKKVMKEVDVEVPAVKGEGAEATETSSIPKSVKQLVEVEEISWIPMENGLPYTGEVFFKKAYNPEYNYPDGTDGVYLNLDTAVTDLNLRGVSGPVNFLLIDALYSAGETFPIVVNITNENLPTSTNKVTIKPNTGVTALIQGASVNSQIIRINNSYVVIDGSNSGGTDRSLTIENTSVTTPQVIGISSIGTTPIVGTIVKNCNIINGVNTSSAVVIRGNDGLAGYFNNITIQNNSIQKAYMGVFCNAAVVTGNGSGLLLTENALDSTGTQAIRYLGLYVQGVDGAIVSKNKIASFSGSDGEDDRGIWFATGTINSTIEANYIHTLKYTGTGGYGGQGIAISSGITGSNNIIKNNMIYDLSGDGWNYTSVLGDNPHGMYIFSTQTGVKVYFNSINLFGNTLNQTSAMSTGISIGTGSSADLRDNIIVNNLGLLAALGYGSAGIFLQTANTQLEASNYNDIYVNPTGVGVKYVGQIAAVGYADLATWQVGSGADANSISADPHFANDNDLHINTGYNTVSNNGLYLASVTTDIDGNARSVTTPDIGADEYIYVPPAVVDPTAVTATPISGSQIDVAFTRNANLNSVLIVWNATGTFTPPVGAPPAVGLPFAGGTVMYYGPTSPASHTGLTQNTLYYYKVFSYNGSLYSPGVEVNATTPCGTISSFPFTENFSASLGCWTASEGVVGASYHWATTTADATHGVGTPQFGTHFAFLYVYLASTTYNPYYLTTPIIQLDATPKQVSYYYWLGTSGYQTTPVPMTLQITTDGGTTWTDLYAHTSSNSVFGTSSSSPWTQNIVSLSAYASQTVQLRFMSNSNYGSGYCDQGIDEFVVENIPSCPAPTGLAITGITNVSANIGWSNATTVDVDYGTPGHPAGTGTVVSGVTTNPYTIGGLTAATPYDVYVRQSCGGGSYSTWAGPLNFTTAINPLALPYTQTFDGATFPAGWSQQGTTWSVVTTSFAGGTPNEMEAYYSSFNGITRLIVGPINTSGVPSLRLAFKHLYDDYGTGITHKIQSSADATTWTDEAWSFASGTGNQGPETVNTTIANNLGTVTYIAWVFDGNHFQFDAWDVDDVVISQPLANDVGTLSIDIASNITPGSIAPQATVKNFGTSTNTFNVQMNITGGYTSTKPVTSLAPGATQQVTFDNWNATLGQYTVKVFTQLGTDGDASNDTLYKNVGVYAGSYSSGSVYPTLTYLGTGVAINGVLYSLGGNTDSGLGTECYKYDVASNTWSPIASLPSGRVVLGSAAVGNFVYAIAGADIVSGSYVTTVYKYDIAGNTWSTVAPLPVALGWVKAVGYNSKIYVAGGADATDAVVSTVYVYDVATDSWATATAMPGPKFGGAFSVTGNKLVYAAGANATVISSDVYVGTIDNIDPTLIVWTTMAKPYPGITKEVYSEYNGRIADILDIRTKEMEKGHLSPDAASYPPGAMYRFDGAPWGSDRIIVASGSPTAAWTPADPNPTYTYNPTSDTWEKQADVPIPVLGASLGTVNSGTTWKLIVASGYLGGFVTSDATQIYTVNMGAATFALSVNVTLGWNMVSAPGLHPTDQNVGTWWPHRTGTVWGFNGTQYVSRTVTTQGEGYWMKNTLAETYNYPAITIVPHNPVPATLGWNMMGGYETSPTITSLKAANPQITGTVWGFNGTQYVAATNLVPGYGYWVKTTAAGNITIPDALAKGNEVVELFKEDWGRIILTDAAGLSYTLYAVKGQVDLSQYEMPPMPPSGSFDIRFSSGRIAEDLNSAIKTIDMSGVTYPLTVRVEGMDIRLQDATGKALNQNLKSGEDVVISDATIQKLMVTSELLPTVYALEQNYPNPFNPSTMIEFSLPEDVGNVKLSIYNALGEKVAELVNTALTAGKYSYQWNAQNVATGMYIYELRTDKFVSVKKMLLLK